MILVPAQNVKHYCILLASDEKLEIYLICPCCNSCIFTTWSKYERYSLPDEMEITIQRVRCSICEVTHALQPSFLFGKIRYTNETITTFIEQLVEEEITVSQIIKNPINKEAPEAITTLRRWFKILAHRCKELLPLLKKELKKQCSKSKFKSIIKNTDANNCQIKDVYNMALQLIKLSPKYDHQGNLLSPVIYLNYFCWQKTGQHLLSTLKFSTT